MKSYNIFKTLSAVALSLVVMSSCTKDFEDINTNPYGVADSDIPVGSRFQTPMQQIVWHNYQTGQNLNSDIYCGYHTPPTIFNSGKYTTYYYFNWNAAVWNKTYNQIMSPISEIIPLAEEINYREYVDICKLIRIMAAHRAVDYYGAIVYSEYGSGAATVSYDSALEIYQTFFEEINEAADDLVDFLDNDPYSSLGRLDDYDYVNGGDIKMWIKFANTLQLRLAMRVVNYDAAWAQEEAEKAVKRNYGVLTSADGNIDCVIELLTNPLWQCSISWNDSMMGASIMSIFNRLDDPRMSVLTAPVESAITDIDGNVRSECVGQYVGVRQGSAIAAKTNYQSFSYMYAEEMVTDDPMVWMKPSEAYFLQAEMALRGWDVNGAGTAQSLYEAGIASSFTETGTSTAFLDTYINNDAINDVPYIDYYNEVNSIYNTADDAEAKYLIDVPVKWDESASDVEKLEKIMTQHYLATYPDGYEGWAIFRRTGFPNLFPVPATGNFSEENTHWNGSRAVPDGEYVRRLPFPDSEYTSNYDEVIKAGLLLDGGEDTAMSKHFWDVDCINYPENNF